MNPMKKDVVPTFRRQNDPEIRCGGPVYTNWSSGAVEATAKVRAQPAIPDFAPDTIRFRTFRRDQKRKTNAGLAYLTQT